MESNAACLRGLASGGDVVRVDPPTEFPAELLPSVTRERPSERFLTSVATGLPLVRTAKELPVSSPASFDTKERIRQAIDIVELVGSYLQLRREGRNYKALCPWHDDTRPSLHINPERQSFKCWVCNLGGDIFSFMMKMENVEFPEALAMLAERAGIALKPQRGGRNRPMIDEKQLLIRPWPGPRSSFINCCKRQPEAEPARRYLAERKISPESMRRFRLGFAPDRWDWLLKQALNSEISVKALETVWADCPQTRWAGALRPLSGAGAVSDSRFAEPAGGGWRPDSAATGR